MSSCTPCVRPCTPVLKPDLIRVLTTVPAISTGAQLAVPTNIPTFQIYTVRIVLPVPSVNYYSRYHVDISALGIKNEILSCVYESKQGGSHPAFMVSLDLMTSGSILFGDCFVPVVIDGQLSSNTVVIGQLFGFNNVNVGPVLSNSLVITYY
jgi:hypothetical protein